MNEIELLRRLIGFDTTSALPNGAIVDLLADFLERPGVEIIRHSSDEPGKTNLIVWIGPRESRDGEGLVLSGHLDTVPARESGWDSDPFLMVERDGNLYGRGTADMKAFVAICAVAAAELDPRRLSRPLVLAFTCDEEIGTLGAASLARTWPAGRPFPRAAVIGEPTSLRVVRMHKGHLKLRVLLHGVAAHSGYPHLGRNAIEAAGKAIKALSAYRIELESARPEHHEHFGSVPYVSLNLATISGGAAINIVPDSCTIELGLRPLPGTDTDELIDTLRTRIASELSDDQFSIEPISGTPAMLAGEDTPIYRALCAATGQTGTVAVSFATDAGWLQAMGMDTVLFGPGSIEVAHRPNEFIPAAEIPQARRVIDALIGGFCIS